jgi:hypothetical protein
MAKNDSAKNAKLILTAQAGYLITRKAKSRESIFPIVRLRVKTVLGLPYSPLRARERDRGGHYVNIMAPIQPAIFFSWS